MQTTTHFDTGSECSARMLIVIMHAMGSAPHPEVVCILDALCFSAVHSFLSSPLASLDAQSSNTQLQHHYNQATAMLPFSIPQVAIFTQDAHATAKASRVGLGLTLQDVKANLRVAQRTKKKQGWEALLGQLTQLREASHLHDKLK